MKSLKRFFNPVHDPELAYCLTLLRVRLDRARAADRSRGASAIEWAIITAAAAAIAIVAGGLILKKVKQAANSAQTSFNPGP
ncbi:MAG: hypothetical protein ACRDN9_11365 [Streptosporangiaceae bacterium]